MAFLDRCTQRASEPRYFTSSQGFASGRLVRPVVQSRGFRPVEVAFLEVLLPEVMRGATYPGAASAGWDEVLDATATSGRPPS